MGKLQPCFLLRLLIWSRTKLTIGGWLWIELGKNECEEKHVESLLRYLSDETCCRKESRHQSCCLSRRGLEEYRTSGTSLLAQMVNSLPTMREPQVQFLGRGDPLEKVMATHSSTLAWKIPWMEELGRLQSVCGVTRSRTWLSDFTIEQVALVWKQDPWGSPTAWWKLETMASSGPRLHGGIFPKQNLEGRI